ncbi:MAG: sugar transferase [Clostridia bacterium]|nr:sugar transferase [Clostridia bacterium]
MKPYLRVKRVLDFIFALVLLIITLPILIIVAIAIKVESKGPVIFKQKRTGKNGKIFTVNKFRTMRVEAEKDDQLLSDKQRITTLGNFLRKTSIDELPQLFNVLKGDMSFIGPRPLLVQYLDLYSTEQMRRHEVTPGISGWAQVNGRNTISWKEKFKYDVWYVDHISLTLDFKIVFMTINKVLKSEGVSQEGQATVAYFKGNED